MLVNNNNALLGWCIWNFVSFKFDFDGLVEIYFILVSIIKYIKNEDIWYSLSVFSVKKICNKKS